MSRPARRCRAAAAVAALAAIAPASGAGQVPVRVGPMPPEPAASARAELRTASPPTEEELLRRIDSLLPVLEEAEAAAAAAERRRAVEEEARPRPATEVVRVGPLHILARREQAELAATLFDDVWSEYFEGVTDSPTLAGRLFVFQWAWRRLDPLRVDPAVTGHADVQHIELTRAWVRTRGVARVRIRDAVWSALRSDLPEGSPLSRWIGSTGYPSREHVSRVLGTAPAGANRACLEGEAGACLAVLGLEGTGMSAPLEAPAMVLLEAVRLGGDGAWPRLLERRDAEPLDALAAAAGTDAEEVIGAWRAALLEERPEVHAGLAAQAARALLWVLAFGALATRSTRWRLA